MESPIYRREQNAEWRMRAYRLHLSVWSRMELSEQDKAAYRLTRNANAPCVSSMARQETGGDRERGEADTYKFISNLQKFIAHIYWIPFGSALVCSFVFFR